MIVMEGGAIEPAEHRVRAPAIRINLHSQMPHDVEEQRDDRKNDRHSHMHRNDEEQWHDPDELKKSFRGMECKRRERRRVRGKMMHAMDALKPERAMNKAVHPVKVRIIEH
jgi:hypothetical protein